MLKSYERDETDLNECISKIAWIEFSLERASSLVKKEQEFQNAA